MEGSEISCVLLTLRVCHMIFSLYIHSQVSAFLNYYILSYFGLPCSPVSINAWQSLLCLVHRTNSVSVRHVNRGEDGLMKKCYHWETEFLIREYPVVRKCSPAAQINNFLCMFSLARLVRVSDQKYTAWESYRLNTCLLTKPCCFWIALQFCC